MQAQPARRRPVRRARCDGDQHATGLTPDDLWGVDRSTQDEDERAGRRVDDPIAERKLEFTVQHVEQVVGAVVDVAAWSEPRRRRPFEEPDGTTRLLP